MYVILKCVLKQYWEYSRFRLIDAGGMFLLLVE